MFLGLRTAAYQVRNLEEAKDWYTRVLDLQPYFNQPFYVGFHCCGFELGLVPDAHAAPNRAPAGVAYWGVADAQATYKRLIEMGAKELEPVQDVGGGILIGTLHDPFGNVLGLIQNPHFKVE